MVEATTATVSPALEHIIERPRLISRLEEGGGSRVVVLAAPAGYGKTTLARQWSDRQTGPVAWLRTTRASADVALLAVQLDDLLASVAPELPREPSKVGSIASVNPSPKPLGRAIVKTFEPLTQDVLLVVDEWEAAGSDEADELLSMLVEGLDIRFLITSRVRPDWFAPRLEVYGDGLEIGSDELAMTDAEAADVLFYVRDEEARDEVAAAAAGWPAVLGLAALNARTGRPKRSGLLPDTLYDYLATELIEGATPEAQEAATVVAVAAVQDVETARLLLGPAPDGRLAAAEARGLLSVEGGRRVAMHRLIKELVVERFRADPSRTDRVSELAAPIVEHRLWSEGQAVAEAVREPDFISLVLAAALPDLLRGGRVASVRKWVELGRAAQAHSPLLDYAEAELSLRDGETLRAYGLGVQAAEALDGDMAARAHLVAAHAAHLTERPERTARHVELAAKLATTAETREGAAWGRFLAALEHQSPRLPALLRSYQSIARPGVDQTLTSASGEISVALVSGGLAEALDAGAVALSVAQGSADPVRHTSVLSVYSYALVAAARYESAIRAAERLLAVADLFELEFPVGYARLNRAAALIGLRRFAAADRILSALEKDTRDSPGSYFEGNLAIQRARLYASVGDPQRGLDVLSQGPGSDWIPGTAGGFLGLRALLLAADGAGERAAAEAEDARARSRTISARGFSQTADAVAALRRGASGATLTQVIHQALDTECLDALVIGMRVAPDLAAHLASDPARHGWLQRLFLASADFSLASAVGLEIPRPARRGQVLSPRESEIHQLVAQGLTNEEIAKLLFISLSTTKVHVKHILDKLGVRSRVEAARLLDDA